jgi:hypothetical protein
MTCKPLSRAEFPIEGSTLIQAEPFRGALKPWSRARNTRKLRQVRKEAAVSKPLAGRGLTRGEPIGGDAGIRNLERGCVVFYSFGIK